MKKAIIVGLVSALSFSAAASGAHAQFSLPGAGLGAKNAPASDAVDPASAKTAFLQKFLNARSEVGAAQISLSRAFGLNDEVAKLEEEQTMLKTGALDKSGIEKSQELSARVSTLLAEKMAQNQALSLESKAEFAAAIPPLMRGTILTAQLPGEATSYANSTKTALSSASMTNKMKLADGAKEAAEVAKNTPGFVKQVLDAYKATLTYGKNNSIPIPSDATAALGSL